MDEAKRQPIEVEVGYALPDAQTVIMLKVAANATLMQAVLASQILERHPEIDLATAEVGIYGKRRAWSDGLNHGDRIEIYRPLRADPKTARRTRARRAAPRNRA